MKQSNSRNNALLTAAALGLGAAVAVRAFLRQQRKTEFAGKVVLITGGSRGLGLLLGRRFAAQGAKVALCARNAAELDRAREDLLTRGVLPENIVTAVCDVSDASQVAAAVRDITAQFGGGVDILVNTAGIIQVGPMETMTKADFEEAMGVHFWGPYHFVEAVLPGMRARKTGRIVNISSIGGLVRFPHLLPYATSKSALVGYSEGLRAEVMKDGIYVTTVCPGLIRTGSPANALFKGQNDKEYAWFAIADSLPGSSMSADKAADEIIEATRYGDPMVVTSLVAQGAALFHGVFPGLTTDLLAVANHLLPSPQNGIGTDRRRGSDSQSPLAPSLLTALTEKAARDNNETISSETA